METRSYIEYENIYEVGIVEGQELLAEVLDKDKWERRNFVPSDVLITEITYSYWSSLNPSGPQATIKSYPIKPEIPPEIAIVYKSLVIPGRIEFSPDSDPNRDEEIIAKLLPEMNFKFNFRIKERQRFFTLNYKLLNNRSFFRCSLSEIIYVFDDHKTSSYEFGYEPCFFNDVVSKQEPNLKRIFCKYVDFKSTKLKKRYNIGLREFNK